MKGLTSKILNEDIEEGPNEALINKLENKVKIKFSSLEDYIVQILDNTLHI